MMGGPWHSVPDLLYETYASGELQRGFLSDPGLLGCGKDGPTSPPYYHHHHHHPRCGSEGAGKLRSESSCPAPSIVCLKSTTGNTTTFTVASASLTLLPNGDDKMCIGVACQQYHLRRPEPITRQPQSKSSRPRYMKVTSEWSTDLFGCMEDEHTCLLGAVCSPCLACSLARQLGESCCVVTCVPGGVFAMRTKLRMQQNIEGSICEDCLTLTCFCPFALCQMARELDNAEIGRLG